MGAAEPGAVPERGDIVVNGNISGRVVRPTRGVELRDGVFVTGKLPLLVCELKCASRRNAAAIRFWMCKLGLASRLVQEVAPGLEAHEVWGVPEALARFTSFAFVADYYLPVASRVGWQGQGTGELKPVHRAPLPHVVGAIKREDQRAESACAARDDFVRRERLFS
jgi:hypothetical protein